LLALVALPLAATLHAQELSEEQRAEIAARIAPVGEVCLQGENCGGKPARSNTPTRASGTMASAPAAKPAKASASEQADNAGDQQMDVAMASADDTAEAVDAASTAGPETAAIDGEAIYNQACVACHASGVGGAPVVGDVDSWSPRIAKGIEALHNSGINGVAGTAMMAKGGRVDLSDQQIMAAVDYMVGASQ
jgi:cytochrome c5